MQFTELEIENFLAIGHIKCHLDEKGLVLVQGENKDDSSQLSNGSGKSSLLDALAFVIYGETARGESGDAVVNNVTKKNCRVSLELEDGSEKYRISRHRKHSKGKNSLILEKMTSEGWHDISGGTTKLTQSAIVKLIGCSHPVFCSAVYAGQEQMPDLPGSTDKVLKMLIEEAAGIDRLQAAYEIARSRMSSVKKSLETIQNERNNLRAASGALNEQILELNKKKNDWDSDRKARLDTAAKDLLEDKKLYTSYKAHAESELTKLPAVESNLKNTDDKLAALDSEKMEESRLRAKYEGEKSLLDKTSAEFKAQQRSVANKKSHMEGLHDKIGSKCGECGKKYSHEDMHDARLSAVAALKEGVSELKDAKTSVLKHREATNNAHTALSSFQSSMTSIAELITLRNDYLSSKEQIELTQRKAKKIADDLKAKLAKVKEAKSEANPFISSIESTKKKIEEIREKDSALGKRIIEGNNNLKLAEEAARVFSPSGVRAHILDTVTPLLNVRTSEYLSILSDGNITAIWSTLTPTAKGELKEKFSITVSSRTGSKTFKGLSGGEKRKVRLATFLALQDLMASRATKPINLWIADEIDAALDDAGLERLMAVLESKARDKGTVLTVSHRSLSDWIRNTVTIVKEAGYARLEGDFL